MITKVIRRSVFETNSSSTHSITIESGDFTYPQLDIEKNIETGEYGWGYDTCRSFDEKASYALTYALNYGIKEDFELFNAALNEVFPLNIITYNGKSFDEILEIDDFGYEFGYIDHQSIDEASTIFESEKTLKNFLFCNSSYVTIDNDNH